MKMKVFGAIVILCLCLAHGIEGRRYPRIITSSHKSGPPPPAPTKKADYDYNEYEFPPNNGRPIVEDSSENEHNEQPTYVHAKHYPPSKTQGYSAGSGLRNIAQGSADQANSAVQNQHAAGKQANYVAQNTLAQAASQAAATAQAALAGKQVLLQGLEQQSVEARQALESEIQQLQQAKRSAKAAQQAAQQSLNHVQILTAALNNAQSTAEHAQQSATEAGSELASQQAMVGTAKLRVEQIEEQLHAARIDYEATQHAATSAAASAQQAQNNAAAAAVHAAIHFQPKELTDENTQNEDFASNHNYGDESRNYASESIQSTASGASGGPSTSHDFEFAGYK